jgi:hypothetical protein
MQILDLVVQIFMAASLISGVTMVVFSLGYSSRLRKVESLTRYTLGFLLVFSVIIRFLAMLPGEFPFKKESSIIFDILYVSICIFYNINILSRKNARE